MSSFPTYADMPKIVATLDKLEFSVLMNSILKVQGKSDEEVPLDILMRACLYEWLVHLGFVKDHQRRFILDQKDFEITSCHAIAIADQRYVWWVHEPESMLDMHRMEWVEKADEPIVTTIMCTLPALYFRKRALLAKLKGVEAKPVTA